jgi:hypothetical protein
MLIIAKFYRLYRIKCLFFPVLRLRVIIPDRIWSEIIEVIKLINMKPRWKIFEKQLNSFVQIFLIENMKATILTIGIAFLLILNTNQNELVQAKSASKAEAECLLYSEVFHEYL